MFKESSSLLSRLSPAHSTTPRWPIALILATAIVAIATLWPAAIASAQHDPGPSGGDPFVVGCNPVHWPDALGGSLTDDARGVAAYDFGAQARGELYVTGSFQGMTLSPAFFGASTANQITGIDSRSGSQDVYLAKLDDCGRWLWVRTGGGSGSDTGEAVVVDSQRNVIVVGTMDGNTTLDMDVGISDSEPQLAAGFGASTIFAAKYSHQGVLQWFKTLGDGTVFDVDVDSNDDVVLTRTTPSGVGALLRLSGATGTSMVQQVFIGNDLSLTGTAVGEFDQLCIVGNFENSVQVGGQSFNASSPFPSSFVALLDHSGALLQMHTLSSPNGEVAANAAATTYNYIPFVWPNGGIEEWDCLVAGRFSGAVTLGYANLISSGSTDRDGWVGRFRSGEADPVSALHVAGSGHQEVTDVSLRETGSTQTWITGFFTDQMLAWDAEQNWEGFASWTAPLVSDGGRDAFLIGYGTSPVTWPTRFGGQGDDEGRGVFVLPQSLRIYTVGHFDEWAEFELPTPPISLGGNNRAQEGYVVGLVKP